MLHTNNQIIKHKVGLLNLAEELQNVSKACKFMGVSRDTFYRYQELASTGNFDLIYATQEKNDLKIDESKLRFGNIENNFVFNYLDFLIYCDATNRNLDDRHGVIKNFKFTQRSSVEYFMHSKLKLGIVN